jgi:hypothetical protein
MMVVLTDTSEPECVNINDWLINQNLARQGKLVRTCNNFPYLHYARRNNIVIQSSVKISDTRNEVGIETRYDKDQLISGGEGMFRLSNDYLRNENEILHNCKVSLSKRIDVQLLRDTNLLETKSLDKKLESNNYSEIDIPKGPKGLNILFEKLKTLNMSFYDSNLDVCTHEINDTFQDDTRLDCALLDSNMKIDVNNNKSYENPSNTCFIVRDSDDEEANFGTFKNMYGSHDLIQPIDWSIIKTDKISSPRTALISVNDSDILIKEHKSNVAKDKTELQNQEKDELLAKLCFLNMTHKEKEYFLTEKNINYDIKDVSQTIIKLRNRIKTCNDKCTTIVVRRKILEELCDNIQFQNTPNSETNVVTINNISFSTQTISKNTNMSKEINETKLNQEIENKNCATDWRLISSKMKNDKENGKKESQKTYKNNLDNSSGSSIINKGFNSRYQKLLEQIKCNAISDLNFADKNESSSNNQNNLRII